MVWLGYWDDVRRELFPEVEDWGRLDLFEDVRAVKNVNKLSYKYWFFWHPSAYSLVVFSIDVVFSLMMFGLAVFLFFKRWYLPMFLPLLFGGWTFKNLVNKIRNYRFTKGVTIGDMLLRD